MKRILSLLIVALVATPLMALAQARYQYTEVKPPQPVDTDGKKIDVFADETTGDVGLRARQSGEDLGSFARAWVIPLGFHPFLFGRTPHMPRLRCGKVVVQRQSWTVTMEELPPGDYTGVSTKLVTAIERLRVAKGERG